MIFLGNTEQAWDAAKSIAAPGSRGILAREQARKRERRLSAEERARQTQGAHETEPDLDSGSDPDFFPEEAA